MRVEQIEISKNCRTIVPIDEEKSSRFTLLSVWKRTIDTASFSTDSPKRIDCSTWSAFTSAEESTASVATGSTAEMSAPNCIACSGPFSRLSVVSESHPSLPARTRTPVRTTVEMSVPTTANVRMGTMLSRNIRLLRV